MFIDDGLVKDVSLTYYDKKQIGLQMYLIDKLPMRYDVSLFQFILNLMEVMCLVQENMKCLLHIILSLSLYSPFPDLGGPL